MSIPLQNFLDEFNLYIENGTIYDANGEEIAAVCSTCRKVEASAATCNCGTFQPEYCDC